MTRRTGFRRRGGYDREAALRRLCIDDATRQALLDFRPHLAERIDGILKDFQDQVMAPQGGSGGAPIRAEQKRRWLDHICAGRFRGADIRRPRRAARAGSGPGVDSPWFMACYCYVLDRAVGLAGEVHADDAAGLAATVQAIHKAVFLDLDLSMFLLAQAMAGGGPWDGVLSAEEIAALLEDR